DALLPNEFTDVRGCEAGFHIWIFVDPQVLIGVGRHLWQVCYHDHLHFCSQSGEPSTYLYRCFATNSRINFIENKCRDWIGICKDNFKSKHDAREFTPRSAFAQRPWFRTWMRL